MTRANDVKVTLQRLVGGEYKLAKMTGRIVLEVNRGAGRKRSAPHP